MAGKKIRGDLGWLLVVHLGRRLMMNNYRGVQERLACVVGSGEEMTAHGSVGSGEEFCF
jgi:hypothetical protein